MSEVLSPAAARRVLQRTPLGHRLAIQAAARKRGTPHVDAPLLFALGYRESGLRNIVGDGGHGRGMFQDDDRWLTEWLRSVRGCRSGSSIPIYASALPHGRVPTVSAGAAKAAATIEGNVAALRRAGVKHNVLKAALSAYNAGIGGALKGVHITEDSDAYTTGRDYGANVLALRRAFAAA